MYINSLRFPRVKIIPNVKYGTLDEELVLDIYQPRKRGEKIPVLVNVHGGFYIYGDKKQRRGFCGYMADNGVAVLNVMYGQAPKYLFVDQIRNVCMVLKWIEENHEKYGFDLSKVALAGDGTGAYIASMAAVANTSSEVRENLDLTGINYLIKTILLFRGYYDVRLLLNSSTLTTATEDKLKRVIIGPDADKFEESLFEKLSPINYVNPNFPDTFLAYDREEFDRAEQASRLKNILRRNGIPHWEFKNIQNRYVRAPETKKSPRYKIKQCIIDAAAFLKLSLDNKITVDEYHEI
ncbi:MAG TPA: alpha/beta hydrolase [Clostridia bacterium]|nr:alpha/beta hydrolase [Clostridia bacterium]